MSRRLKGLSFVFAAMMVFVFAVPSLAASSSAASGVPFADNPVKRIAKELSPAVVNIDVESRVTRTMQSPFDDDPVFKRFFGDEFRRFSRSVPMKGRGSGFIVSKDGQVLTNNHVVEGAEKITVTLSNGKVYNARVLGKDPTFDLAVIQMEGKDSEEFPVLELGDSDAIDVGDWVVAIGNPFGLEHTVTVGVISAKNRSIHAQNVNFDGFLQTDAAINPGNSGGPLIGFDGKVVGINTAIIPYAQGLGFAIPVNMAKQVISDLVQFGKVKRGWLGVSIQNMTPEFAEAYELSVEEGIIIGDVFKDSAAEKAGLKRGDVVTAINGEKMKNVSVFVAKVRTFAPGTEISLTVLRDKKEETVKVKLDEIPGSELDGGTPGQGEQLLREFGITVSQINAELQKKYRLDAGKGLVISGVEPGSEAQRIGLNEGDVIVEVNNRAVEELQDVDKIMAGKKAIVLLIERGGKTFFVTLRTPDTK